MNDNLSPRHDIPSYWRAREGDAAFLHLGENPFPPTPRVLQAICKAAENANRYPDTNCLTLRERIAEYVGCGVKPENIICGNGSDELIDLAVVSFGDTERPAATFAPSFFVYGFAAQRHGVPFESILRTDDYDLPSVDSILKDARNDYSITFIANPNNPTGTLTRRERLVEYLNQWPGIVVIDECYYEYAGETVVDLIHQYENLLVFRSLSKSFGLSGLRLGYAVASRILIDRMERRALTFPVNVCAQAAGIAALADVEEYRKRIRDLIEKRDRLQNDLQKCGLETVPSHANFVLALWPESWSERNPARLLAERGILVSDQSANMKLGRPALRIGVGTDEENARLVKAVREPIA